MRVRTIQAIKPLRDVALNHEELLNHAVELARYHLQVSTGKGCSRLFPRVKENVSVLRAAHDTINHYIQKTKEMVPAAEWFLDNYYLLKDLELDIKQNLPRKYERQLPCIDVDKAGHYPRVFLLMRELVEHTDSQISGELLRDFVNAYQSILPLSSAEIWAIPLMLRINLLENIRRLVDEILMTQSDREEAERWIAPFLQIDHSVENWEQTHNSVDQPWAYSTAYAERLLRRIRELGVDATPLLHWFDRLLSRQDATIEGLAKLEHQQQAMCQVSMGHSITSIRFLAEEDWPRFFEELSPVQKLLKEDPTGIFMKMDFYSRDKYRHQVERIARHYEISETVVARSLLERSLKRVENGELSTAHIGFDLFGKGYLDLEKELEKEWGGIRRFWCQLKHWVRNKPQMSYFGGILLSTIILIILLSPQLFMNVKMGWGDWLYAILILWIPITALTIPGMNWLVAYFVPPAFFPRLELQTGIPEEFRTVIVVPTLLTSVERVNNLLKQLEICYLANQQQHLHFAILGDFRDADAPTLAEDQEILQSAVEGIKFLNQKYRADGFYFLNRKRLWNDAEKVWMGWERKRGKLIEFNRFMRQGGSTSYETFIGELDILQKIKYVITLDADTELPRGVAKKLIGTLAHPLQVPHLNDEGTRIVQGYGVLQPRIAVSILSARASLFALTFSGKTGIDPYTTAVSDVYQDLFDEGIFTGKGIYDVDIFHKMTGDAFPENQILSHDLIEGLYARAGLVTDIELVDGYPGKYQAYMKRLHRWVRGDWQIMRWLAKDLSFLAKWKIFDNLRRSLEAPSQVLLILLGFISFNTQPSFWVGFVGFTLFWPNLLAVLNQVFRRRSSTSSLFDLKDIFYQWCFQAATLLFQATIQLDAILRSLVRQFLTHKHLLEWETAADAEQRLDLSLKTSLRKMWIIGLELFVFTCWIYYYDPFRVFGFLMMCFIWGASPFLAYAYSLPLKHRIGQLSSDETQELRLWARQIWAFFEEYVTPLENWLPPDNVQIDPPNGIAHRTSPTNIGFALLTNLAAFELGYQTMNSTLERIEGSLVTLEKMEQWKGHYYNWYDTLTLQPLHPLYVSTVDSGNLVVYLLTLSQGVLDLLDQSIVRSMISGLADTFQLVKKYEDTSESEEQAALEKELTSLNESPLNLWLLQAFLEKWEKHSFEREGVSEEALFWTQRFQRMLQSFAKEIAQTYPSLQQSAFVQIELKGSSGDDLLNLSIKGLLDRYRQEINKEGISQEIRESLRQKMEVIRDMTLRAEKLSTRLRKLALATDFRPLFDTERQLFSIGYRVNERTLDLSYYDLLASEARQASFIAIAKGDIPEAHWFRLGRALTQVKGRRSLVSWSGTMFEFTMPLLLMRNYPGTLLDETYHSVVEIQRLYALEKGIPWGISESGYYTFDPQLNYQYKAFGVPGLGLKRGLVQEIVIAPYATFMALLIEPLKGLMNIRRMVEMGFSSRYGLYEAVDFTRERIPLKQNFQVIKSYMAHHQGMSFLALSNVLLQNRMQQLFHADPLVQATELLLQERLPGTKKIVPHPETIQKSLENNSFQKDEENRFISHTTADTLVPLTHFVSNGEYSVMMTNAGSGYSRFKGLAISRWREDVTRDAWGMYFYIQNLNSGDFWSATHQPCQNSGDDYRVTYAPDRMECYRKDGNISTKLEVIVSPDDAVETRRITLTNHSQNERMLEVTSYFEVVLMRAQDELAHPAFANLFIQTEFTHQALIATRRPRRQEQERHWLMHTVAVEGDGIADLQYETDRSRFLGRSGRLAHPQALELNQPLSNSVGAVLDPIMSLRQRVSIKAGQTAKISFSTGIAATREGVIRLAEKYREPSVINRVFELSWTQSQMELKHLNMTSAQANDALSLGSQLLYLSPCRRDNSERLMANRKGQSSLWPYAISGDLPLVLVLVKETQHLDFIRQILTIHEYWRMKGLYIDLVILNQDETGYMQAFQDMLRDLVSVGHARDMVNRSGGIFLLQQGHMPDEDVTLLFTVARVVLTGDGGSCSVQFRKKGKSVSLSASSSRKKEQKFIRQSNAEVQVEKIGLDLERSSSLLYFNGYGGFNAEGTEYILLLKEGMKTPLPWLNVIANPRFGCQISESGSGYTWSGNSRENKLTPWSNDPILDTPGEVLYIRDDMSELIWSPTPSPIREQSTYEVHHGQGYTLFKHFSHDLQQELLVFVPLDKPLKIMNFKLKNQSKDVRKLTLTYYVEWVLGVARDLSAPFIITDFEEELSTILAKNTYQDEFANRIAFQSGFGDEIFSYTGDRTEFIGRNGDLRYPKALTESELSRNTGAGYDPCGALQYHLQLDPGEERQMYFLLGEGESIEEVKSLLSEFRNESKIQQAIQEVKDYWNTLLNRVAVRTPEKSMDLLLNRWLLYQTVVCRLWARSAFYQSGGAFGFRDQLQDVMALTLAAPEMTRSQILLHCAHQFVEGDVQHWWHAEQGKGIRTKFSDDLLWLPFVTADYLEHTQDEAILEEIVPYLEDQPLGEEEDERYSIPQIAPVSGTVYEHCIRALERGLNFGEHGLPLIGSGDWNDGFSRIGVKGKGESVWLGWFLITTLNRFASVCDSHQDPERAEKYRNIVQNLKESMEKNAWDGGWYRRAYFDDGTPLGSSRNPECQIDAIAQSWGVISGGARTSRIRDSMTALENYLWRKEEGVLLLLSPPFDRSSLDPGYIKGYVPGVRENGGQYTHGAIWSIMAFTAMEEGNKALELFNMLNPINHARNQQEVARYKVEPYVMTADVYAIYPHVGRGGWSWYTGAAGWMYQAGLEGILGLFKQGEKLTLVPCIPAHWKGYEIDYRFKTSLYQIKVDNPHGKMSGVESVIVDGTRVDGNQVELLNDGKEHIVQVIL